MPPAGTTCPGYLWLELRRFIEGGLGSLQIALFGAGLSDDAPVFAAQGCIGRDEAIRFGGKIFGLSILSLFQPHPGQFLPQVWIARLDAHSALQ